MKSLPTAFRGYLAALAMSDRHVSIKRLHRFLILRLQLWRDGIQENAIPGYPSPPPDGPHGYPLGWSISSIRKTLSELRFEHSTAYTLAKAPNTSAQ